MPLAHTFRRFNHNRRTKKESSHTVVVVTTVGAGCSLTGVTSSPCQGSPFEELNQCQLSRVEHSRSQHSHIRSPLTPPRQPELPGDTGRDWLRHFYSTLTFLWRELNVPVLAATCSCSTTVLRGVFPSSETFPEASPDPPLSRSPLHGGFRLHISPAPLFLGVEGTAHPSHPYSSTQPPK